MKPCTCKRCRRERCHRCRDPNITLRYLGALLCQRCWAKQAKERWLTPKELAAQERLRPRSNRWKKARNRRRMKRFNVRKVMRGPRILWYVAQNLLTKKFRCRIKDGEPDTVLKIKRKGEIANYKLKTREDYDVAEIETITAKLCRVFNVRWRR